MEDYGPKQKPLWNMTHHLKALTICMLNKIKKKTKYISHDPTEEQSEMQETAKMSVDFDLRLFTPSC